MSLTKVTLLLGATMIGLLGTIHYLKFENDSMVIEIKGHDMAQRFNLFKEWAQKHKRSYGAEETKKRFAIWNKMHEFIQTHNAKDEAWTAGHNQFSDLTREEFSAMNLGYRWNTNRKSNVKILDESVEVPTSIDWRTKGAVTPVKNQQQCGGCWAFSTTGALEGLAFISQNLSANFSEQQLIDCSSDYGNSGCSGGLMDDAFQYVEAQGIMTEEDYPFIAANGTSCNYDSSKVVFSNTGYADVKADSPTQLKAAVAKGPVSIAIEADSQAFQSYSGGVFKDSSCGTTLDHGVLIVGYSGSSYWIVKNSWGPTWGDQGYIKIEYGNQSSGKGICGINMQPSYPTA